uniref:10 kDa family memberl n=1 Tax=Nyssomyia intermedia TaxID=182990 RepID=J7HEZ9_9DIPT
MKCFVIVAILFLVGQSHVDCSCKSDVTDRAVKLFNQCKKGEIEDVFPSFSAKDFKNLKNEGIELVKKCLDIEAGRSHGKCKQFMDLKDCYLEENVCRFENKPKKQRKSQNSKRRGNKQKKNL